VSHPELNEKEISAIDNSIKCYGNKTMSISDLEVELKPLPNSELVRLLVEKLVRVEDVKWVDEVVSMLYSRSMMTEELLMQGIKDFITPRREEFEENGVVVDIEYSSSYIAAVQEAKDIPQNLGTLLGRLRTKKLVQPNFVDNLSACIAKITERIEPQAIGWDMKSFTGVVENFSKEA